jgi:hypothetical protein
MELTRKLAVRLAREGFLEILQRGAPIDLSKPIRGPVRLRKKKEGLAGSEEAKEWK